MPVPPSPLPPVAAARPPDGVIALWVLAGFALFFLGTAAVNAASADAVSMLRVARRLAEHGFASLPGQLNGATVSKYGIGQSLLELPWVGFWQRGLEVSAAATRIWCGLLLSSLPALGSAAMLAGLYLCGRRLGYGPRLSLGVTLLAGLATMSWPYAQGLLSDSSLGWFWVWAWYGLLRYRQEGREGWLALAGAALGYTLLLKPMALGGLPPFLVYAAWAVHQREGRTTAWRPALALGLPLALGAALVLAYNHWRYGSPWETGYGADPNDRDVLLGFQTPLATGLLGLLFSSGKGFFWYNPALLLGLLGWPLLARRQRAEAWLLLAFPVLLLLLHAKWWAWHGDFAWGPRFLAPAAPFLALPAGAALAALAAWAAGWRRRLAGAGVAALLTVSVGVQVLGVAIDAGHYIEYISTVVRPLGGYYHAGDWPIRDDGLALHFIPEFSPLAAHAWLLGCLVAPDPQTRAARFAQPPWLGLNPRWAPPPRAHFPYWRVWWIFAWAEQVPQWRSMVALAAALTLAAGGCLAGAWRASGRRPA